MTSLLGKPQPKQGQIARRELATDLGVARAGGLRVRLLELRGNTDARGMAVIDGCSDALIEQNPAYRPLLLNAQRLELRF